MINGNACFAYFNKNWGIPRDGDAYMAVGGVPAADRRHPIDACLAALEMQETVARIRSRSEKMRLPAIAVSASISGVMP